MYSCPALRFEVDTLRWAVRADVQGQTAARHLCERSGREEETGIYRKTRTRRSTSTMTTTPSRRYPPCSQQVFCLLLLCANRYLYVASYSFDVYSLIRFPWISSVYAYSQGSSPLTHPHSATPFLPTSSTARRFYTYNFCQLPYSLTCADALPPLPRSSCIRFFGFYSRKVYCLLVELSFCV